MTLSTLMRELLSPSNLVGPLAEMVLAAGLSWAFSSLSSLRSVEADLDNLRLHVDGIHALLKDTEETRIIDDNRVRHRLSLLKDFALDVDDLINEFECELVRVETRPDSPDPKQPADPECSFLHDLLPKLPESRS